MKIKGIFSHTKIRNKTRNIVKNTDNGYIHIIYFMENVENIRN